MCRGASLQCVACGVEADRLLLQFDITRRNSEAKRLRQARKAAAELKAEHDERIEAERRRIAKKKKKVGKKEKRRRPWRYIKSEDHQLLPIVRPPELEIPKRSYQQEEDIRNRLRRR